jgi:hypothetical protein
MHQSQNQLGQSGLAGLFEICSGKSIGWGDADLTEIFEHQLRTPLLQDMRAAPAVIQLLDSAMFATLEQPLKTFGDLFRHSNPPIELLRSVKDFAKTSDGPMEDALPAPVASALYTLAIAAAMARLGARITTMSDAELRQGFDWVIAQSWIDAPIRQLAVEALATLRSD